MSPIALRCVECGAEPLLPATDGEFRCHSCNHSYRRHEYRSVPVLVSSRSALAGEGHLALPRNHARTGRNAARSHWRTGNLARLLEFSPGRKILNYGCGDGGDRPWLESKGYEVTAFDVYPSEYTDYVCDGHELPFADEQFDIVAAISVLQYMSDPFQAAREICRVLKPGGTWIGSIAFLEVQDSGGYFHMTQLGLRELLRRTGFDVVEVSPGWSYQEALSHAFWIWNEIPVVSMASRVLNRASFWFGIKLWQMGYGLRGKKMPEDWPTRFAGSLVFKAVRASH